MQVAHEFSTETALPVGWGVRVLVVSVDSVSFLQQRVAGLGGLVEIETEVFSALAAVIDDPMGYGLVVIDCDGFGGVEAGQRAAMTLFAANCTVPVILLSRSFTQQVFPQGRQEPICLRAPVSGVSLRVGFEHALRDRLIWRAA